MARRASSSPRVAARPSPSPSCGDLAGSIVSMWIVEVLGANPHQLGDLRGLLLGAAHLRGNVADVLGLDVAVLVALLRVHLLLHR